MFLVVIASLFLSFSTYAETGHSLQEDWDDLWRRQQDRIGRVAPNGPALQPLSSSRLFEYELDRSVSRYPLRMEKRWVDAKHAARFWVHSIDEFTLANGTQLKLRTPMSETTHVGFRLDRRDDRDHRSLLLRVDFDFERLGDTPFYVKLRLFPRWEKDDSDAEFVIGWHQPRRVDLRLRMLAFDPFANASHSLAESRAQDLDVSLEQRDLPLALSLEAVTVRMMSVRAELFVGRRLSAQTDLRFPSEPNQDHVREVAGWFSGVLLEWHRDDWPIWVGLSMLSGRSSTRWLWKDLAITQRDITEEVSTMRLYALGEIRHDIQLEASVRRSILASTKTGEMPPGDSLQDSGLTLNGRRAGWLYSFVLEWLPSTVGAEMGYVQLHQDERLEQAERRGRVDQRLLTRCVFQFGSKVWLRVGVGWDLDDRSNIYDGGGMTLTAEL